MLRKQSQEESADADDTEAAAPNDEQAPEAESDCSAEAPVEPSSGDDPGYAEAMEELEQILADLEGEDADVDVLGMRVERAAHLIEVCRRRITDARMKVEQVVIRIDPDLNAD